MGHRVERPLKREIATEIGLMEKKENEIRV